MKNVINDPMLSLFDYLGHAAGRELGEQVWKAAKQSSIKPAEKMVTTKTYSGKILMYPKSFLDRYFANKRKIQ